MMITKEKCVECLAGPGEHHITPCDVGAQEQIKELRSLNDRLRAALVDCAHAGCPSAAESIAAIEGSPSEGDPQERP